MRRWDGEQKFQKKVTPDDGPLLPGNPYIAIAWLEDRGCINVEGCPIYVSSGNNQGVKGGKARKGGPLHVKRENEGACPGKIRDWGLGDAFL